MDVRTYILHTYRLTDTLNARMHRNGPMNKQCTNSEQTVRKRTNEQTVRTNERKTKMNECTNER